MDTNLHLCFPRAQKRRLLQQPALILFCMDSSGEDASAWLISTCTGTKLSITSFRFSNKDRSQLLHLQENTVVLASVNEQKMTGRLTDLPLRNISPFVCFAHFQVYLQLGGSKLNERACSEKHKRRFHLSSASELPNNQQIGWCSLPL